jgi:RNA polymerase sigma-70 factor (ECF subfamily)
MVMATTGHSVDVRCLAVADDRDLVARLQAGDESAFVELVRTYQPRLQRLAESVVSSRSVAEEVVQDTWLAVVRGVERFEGRSTFKTWLFHILLNRARSAVGREHRALPLSSQDVSERFDASGAWSTPPVPWAEEAEDRLVAQHLADRVRELLPDLPAAQREVLLLRDIEGVSAPDVCELLGVSDGNQRVLLHRARVHLRQKLDLEMQS